MLWNRVATTTRVDALGPEVDLGIRFVQRLKLEFLIRLLDKGCVDVLTS